MSAKDRIAEGAAEPAKKRRNRKSTGQLVEQKGKRGTTWGVRFRLPDGRRVFEKVGPHKGEGPITKAEAQQRADRILAQVALAQYRTKAERAAERAAREAEVEVPVFAAFSDAWLERRKVLGGSRGKGLSESGRNDLTWRISHLQAWFGGMRLDEITEEEVERYATAKRAAKVREGGLGATSTNKTLACLEAIMKTAVRYRHVDRDPVDGYRVPTGKTRREIMYTAAQVEALLKAAGELDARRRGRRGHGRALIATMVFGGLRIGEVLALKWRDVDLASGVIRVRDGKTENSRRVVDILPPLRDELAELKARRSGGRDELVFGTATGRMDSPSNVRDRTFSVALKMANEALDEADEELIPAGLKPHGCRHSMISVLVAVGGSAGYDIGHIADIVGHADPGFTLKTYRHRIRREGGELERLRVLFLGEPVEEIGGAAQSMPSAVS